MVFAAKYIKETCLFCKFFKKEGYRSSVTTKVPIVASNGDAGNPSLLHKFGFTGWSALSSDEQGRDGGVIGDGLGKAGPEDFLEE